MQLHSQVLSPAFGAEGDRSNTQCALPRTLCHTGQDELVPDQMDWVHDLRDYHLDAPVKHMTLNLGRAEIVDPILLAPLLSRVKSIADFLFKRTVAHMTAKHSLGDPRLPLTHVLATLRMGRFRSRLQAYHRILGRKVRQGWQTNFLDTRLQVVGQSTFLANLVLVASGHTAALPAPRHHHQE